VGNELEVLKTVWVLSMDVLFKILIVKERPRVDGQYAN
jgi:hypothetical protein